MPQSYSEISFVGISSESVDSDFIYEMMWVMYEQSESIKFLNLAFYIFGVFVQFQAFEVMIYTSLKIKNQNTRASYWDICKTTEKKKKAHLRNVSYTR